MNINRHLNLDGSWDLQCYEYNYDNERLQLHRVPVVSQEKCRKSDDTDTDIRAPIAPDNKSRKLDDSLGYVDTTEVNLEGAWNRHRSGYNRPAGNEPRRQDDEDLDKANAGGNNDSSNIQEGVSSREAVSVSQNGIEEE